jgi:hypothetical protein
VPIFNDRVITTLRDGSGADYFVIYEFFDPATKNMADHTVTTSTGSKTGALIVDNLTGRTQAIVVHDATGAVVKTFSVPVAGVAFTAAQLAANKQNNGGPVTNMSDLEGLSSSLT